MIQAERYAEMSRLDRLIWELATTSAEPVTLEDLVTKARGKPHEPLTVETLIVDDEAPLEVISEGQAQTELASMGLVSVLRVHDDRGSFVLSAWPTAYEGVFHLMGSVPSTDDRWKRVERWVGQASPRIVPCFLDHDDFRDIGTALSEHGEVEVSRLTARRRSDMSSLSRGWPQQVGTLRPSHIQAIADTATDEASVRSLTLHISRNDMSVLSLHLRRLAGASFYNGDFVLFESIVLGRLAAAAGRRAALLTGRERKVNEPLLSPISIRLPQPIFVDADATGEVIIELERGTALTVAVLHRNPYMHAVVVDNADGSNFDVTVTVTDVIDIFPGFRASTGAFVRLTQRLSERFEALEILEAQPLAQVSLDDMVTSA